jgi:hypothetical protein
VLATFQLPVPTTLAKPRKTPDDAGIFSILLLRNACIRNTELESSVNPQTGMFAQRRASWRRLSCRRVLATFQLPVPTTLVKPRKTPDGTGSFSTAPPSSADSQCFFYFLRAGLIPNWEDAIQSVSENAAHLSARPAD